MLGLVSPDGRPLVARVVAATLNGTVAVLFLRRAPALAHGSLGALLRALPSALIAGVAWRYAPRGPWPTSALVVLAGGGLWTVASLATLGRSFAILPAAREVVARGPYRLVRHPAYLGELVMVLGTGLATDAVHGVLYAASAALLCVPRILDEEALLERAPDHAAYRAHVPSRLVPGIW